MNTTRPVKVSVTRHYSAPPERVFDAWLDPAMIGRWMFGPALRDEEIVSLSCDGRLGGSFSFVVRRNGQELDHYGQYLEFDRPRRLVFTWGIKQDSGDSSKVFIDIVPAGDGADLTLIHELDPAWADFANRTEQGWTTMLDALGKALA